RGLNPESFVSQLLNGLPQTRLVTTLSDNFAAKEESIVQHLEAIRARMLNRKGLTVSFTGTASVGELLRRTVDSWSRDMRAEPINALQVDPPALDQPPMDGLAAPMQVAFCSRVIPAPHLSHPDAPLLSVGARIVSL